MMELISKEMIDMHKNSEYGQWGYDVDLRYALSRINSRCQYAFNHLNVPFIFSIFYALYFFNFIYSSK